MIRKDKFTYHLSVDPIFMYGLNSLLGEEFQSLTMNGKMGFHKFMVAYAVSLLYAADKKSLCLYFTPCGSKHILVTAPNYRDTSCFLFE